MEFSLFYFSDDSGTADADRYRLVLEGARFADKHGFHAVWTPERHFHRFGGAYPNPSVTGAAIAAVTSRVKVRAGSVVAPLHHPLRIAEEWSVVDNISHGRVGMAFAPGWHATDFALNPSAYADRKGVTFERLEQVRTLWRGEPIDASDGVGNPSQVRVFPPPVQEELPVWIASHGDINTIRRAARARAGLLTGLLGQNVDQLGDKIAEYRKVVSQASPDGWPGNVVVMVHAFLGADNEVVREQVRPSLSAYIRSSLGLVLTAKDLGDGKGPGSLKPEEIDFLVERSFGRYFDNDGLLGSVDKARKAAARLQDIGVDEIACLIDFGLPADDVLSGLPYLNQLQELCAAAEAPEGSPMTGRGTGLSVFEP